jgi:hypothetical protein
MMNRGLLIRFGLLALLVFGAFHVAKADTCRDRCQDQFFFYTGICEEVYPDLCIDFHMCFTGAAFFWSDCIDACDRRLVA